MGEKDDFHVDMSGRIYNERTIGIALVGTKTKKHSGCALKGNLLKLIKRELFRGDIYEDSAKLYAFCIYLLVKETRESINLLVICNDEDFAVVKPTLERLLGAHKFGIISISEFRKQLGRNVGSFADNYAKVYRKRALKPNRWAKGRELNVKEVTFKIVKRYWDELNQKK